MESTKCKKSPILQKKLEIKTIINDFREFIEVCGSNYSERTVNTLKKHLTKQENLFWNEEDDYVEDLKNCIESLNSLKNKCFEENQYQSKNARHSEFNSNTFIKTPE